LESLGLEMSDLFPERERAADVREPIATVEAFASARRLPVAALQAMGWSNGPRGIEISYGEGARVKVRHTMGGANRFSWQGKGTITAYVPDATLAQQTDALMCEGESDPTICAFAGFRAVGLPGADMTKVLRVEHIAGAQRIFVAVDVGKDGQPDTGAQKFVPGVRGQLEKLGFRGEVFELRMPDGAKDACELWVRDPQAFAEKLRATMRAASEPEPSPRPVELLTLGSLLGPAIDRMAKRQSGEETPIPLPWSDYAEQMGGGLWPGAHALISGTGVGKSALSLQTALGAARAHVPVAYVGLELEELQIAARVIGDEIGTRWSDLYLGRAGAAALSAARQATASLEALPFYCEFGNARGWPISRLATLCESMRRNHPQGPMLVALDYLQLIGDESDPLQRKPETRDRISAASMAARDVARRFDVAVLLISSAARTHYGLLASDGKDAGLGSLRVPGKFAPVRTIMRPNVLVGLGKESGETEFSADSVTVLLRWPASLPSGETPIIVATAKNRSGGAHWCALAFNGGRFRDLPVESVDDLPEVTKQGGRGKPVDADEMVERAVEAVRKAGTGVLKSRTAVASKMTGSKAKTLAAVAKAIETGLIVEADGFSVRDDSGTYR
jgi:replicative DNA helicase